MMKLAMIFMVMIMSTVCAQDIGFTKVSATEAYIFVKKSFLDENIQEKFSSKYADGVYLRANLFNPREGAWSEDNDKEMQLNAHGYYVCKINLCHWNEAVFCLVSKDKKSYLPADFKGGTLLPSGCLKSNGTGNDRIEYYNFYFKPGKLPW